MIRRALLTILASAAFAAENPTVDLDAKEKPLHVLLGSVADQLKADLLVKAAAGEAVGQQVTISVDHVSWPDAARMLHDNYGIEATLSDGRLVVDLTTAVRIARMDTRIWDVRTIVGSAFGGRPGPNLEIPEPGGTGSRLLPPIESEVLMISDLGELIRRQVEPRSWSAPAALTLIGGSVMVTNEPRILDAIPKALAGFERSVAQPVLARLWKLPAAPAGGEIVPATAVADLVAARGAPACSLLCIDGVQNHVYAGLQHTIVADGDINNETMDPVPSVLMDGLCLDLDAHGTEGGLVCTVRLTAAETKRLDKAPLSDANGVETMTIDLPERRHDAVRGTWVIPDGGGCVLRLGEEIWLLVVEQPK